MSAPLERARSRAADRLLRNDGNVLKALAEQAPGGMTPEDLKAIVLPELVANIKDVLPWPLRNNKDVITRLAGRIWGVVASAAIVAVEADRAGARATALEDVKVDVAAEVLEDLTHAAGLLPTTDLDREPTTYRGAARAGAHVRRALRQMREEQTR